MNKIYKVETPKLKKLMGEKINKNCRLKGEFLLKSGITSKIYFDKYLFESDPYIFDGLLSPIAIFINDNFDTEYIFAGLEMGGISIATALSLKMFMPMVQIRKKPKKYGTCKAIEGIEVKNKNIIIIEDVITSGSSVIDAIKKLEEVGAVIKGIICVIDRSNDEFSKKVNYPVYSLFTKDYLDSLL